LVRLQATGRGGANEVMIMKNPSIAGKLSKRFLLSLPEGVYLVSNVMDAPGQPIFAQTVAPVAQCLTQWQAIVAARVNHRLCHVFRNPADYLTMSLDVPYPRERN
jgi:hypothetical protein